MPHHRTELDGQFTAGECTFKVDTGSGDVIRDISFVTSGSEHGVIKSVIPGLQHTVVRREPRDVSLLRGSVHAIDHIALVVELDQAETIAQWYASQFGLIRLDDVTVKTEFNGLLLKILRSEQAEFYIVFACSLSAPGQFDQVKEFLSKNGPGLQHVAFKCDIMKHVKQLHNFVQFIKDGLNAFQSLC